MLTGYTVDKGNLGTWRTCEEGPEVCLVNNVWNTLHAHAGRVHMLACSAARVAVSACNHLKRRRQGRRSTQLRKAQQHVALGCKLIKCDTRTRTYNVAVGAAGLQLPPRLRRSPTLPSSPSVKLAPYAAYAAW